MPIDPDLVRQARLKAGLSLAQVAGTELTRQAVHLIETGKVRPSSRSLQVIARRLGVPAHSFEVAADPAAELPHRRAAELERLCERRRFAEVVELAQQLLADATVPDDVVAFAHLYLGRAMCRLARPDEAIKHLRRARRLFERHEDAWSAAEARDWEGSALSLKEDPRAVAVSEDALHRYRSLEPRRTDVEARMLEHLATHLAQQMDFVRALRCYSEALHVAGRLVDLMRLGRIYHGMARCHVSLGDLGRAIDLMSRAAALYAVENDLRPAPGRIDLARIENDLGCVFMLDGQLGRADELLRGALVHLAETGVERLRSAFLLSMAELRQRQGRLDEAVDMAEAAIESAEQVDERLTLSAAHRHLGELREERREHELADRSFDRALAILTEAGMAQHRAECLTAYHRVLEARGAPARLERSAG